MLICLSLTIRCFLAENAVKKSIIVDFAITIKMGIRSLTIIILTLFSTCVAFAQSNLDCHHLYDYVNTDTIIPFRNETTGAYSKIMSSDWGDEVLFTNYNSRNNNDTIVFYCVNTINNAIETIKIVEPGISKKMRSNYENGFSAIVYMHDKIVVGFGTRLIVYERNDGQFVKRKEFTLREDYKELQALNDTMLVGSDCYYPNKPALSLFLLDLSSGKIVKKISPSYTNNAILFSFFCPYRHIDAKYGSIFLSMRGDYSIQLYDKNLDCIDSISKQCENWTMFSEPVVREALAQNKNNAADIIGILMDDYHVSDQIRWIYSLDSVTLVAVHSGKVLDGKVESAFLDVWKRTAFGWKDVKTDLYDDAYKRKGDVFDNKSIPVGFGMGCNIHFLPNNKIVSISCSGSGVDNMIGMNKRDYGRITNDYLLDNDTYIQCIIFSHTLNSAMR